MRSNPRIFDRYLQPLHARRQSEVPLWRLLDDLDSSETQIASSAGRQTSRNKKQKRREKKKRKDQQSTGSNMSQAAKKPIPAQELDVHLSAFALPSKNQNASSRLLSLPDELQSKIYDFLADEDVGKINLHTHLDQVRQFGILRACQTTYRLAKPLYDNKACFAWETKRFYVVLGDELKFHPNCSWPKEALACLVEATKSCPLSAHDHHSGYTHAQSIAFRFAGLTGSVTNGKAELPALDLSVCASGRLQVELHNLGSVSVENQTRLRQLQSDVLRAIDNNTITALSEGGLSGLFPISGALSMVNYAIFRNEDPKAMWHTAEMETEGEQKNRVSTPH